MQSLLIGNLFLVFGAEKLTYSVVKLGQYPKSVPNIYKIWDIVWGNSVNCCNIIRADMLLIYIGL
jgi:hypothetical protein